MKHLSVVSVATAATLLMVGCDRAQNIAGPQSNAPPSPSFDALHQTSNTMDIPWDSEEADPCTGDMVTISGVTHFLFVTTDDGSGGFHLSSRVNSTGTGLGAPSGFTYNVKDDFSYMEQDMTPGTTARQVDDAYVLGPRSVDNYIRHMVFKLTINALGVPTVTFDNSSTKCVG
jgi:hypothetical protein